MEGLLSTGPTLSSLLVFTATVTEPPATNYPTMHNRLVHQDRTPPPKSEPTKSLITLKIIFSFAMENLILTMRKGMIFLKL